MGTSISAAPKARVRSASSTRNLKFRQERKKLAQAQCPAFEKIDVLGMRDLKRCIEGGRGAAGL
jgi:hypothetical protein